MPDNSSLPERRSALVRIAALIDRVLGWLERASLAIACLALVAIMTLIFLDGSLRYIANSPLVFAVDVVNLYLISAAFLLVLSYTLRHGGHISVDVFAHAMSDRVQALVVGIGLLCASPVVAVMAYEMTHLSMESWEMGEVQVGVYAMPLWLSKAIVAFGMVLLFLRVLHLGVFNFLSGVTGNKALAYPILPMPEHAEEEMV